MHSKTPLCLLLISVLISVQSQLTETEFVPSGGFSCTTLEECQQKVEELEQENQDLRLQLEYCENQENTESNEEMTFSGESEEEEENEDNGFSFDIQSYLTSLSGLNSYSMDLSSPGTFYISTQNTGDGYSSLYLSSTCDCDSSADAIPPTSSNNCRSSSSSSQNNLMETASGRCTVYFSIDAPSDPVRATAWFYPLTSLSENSLTTVDFPYANSFRTFTHTVYASEVPLTVYLRAYGKDTQTYTNLYVTADCFSSCLDSSSYTEFPNDSNYCWSGSTNSGESYLALRVTDRCNIYYSVKSSVQGESAQVMLTVHQTIALETSQVVPINFPIRYDYRTFYQDLAEGEAFYINSYPTDSSTSTYIYLTNNCTDSCVESSDNTVFPVSNKYCASVSNTYHFEATTSCRVYYSVYSSALQDAVNVKVFVYPLSELERDTLNLIYFPLDSSYRWFYEDIQDSDSMLGLLSPSSFNITSFSNDNSVSSYVYATTTCISSCFESSDFTEFPTSSTYCWSGYDSLTVDLTEASFPCRVYYSLYSSKFGDKINVRISV